MRAATSLLIALLAVAAPLARADAPEAAAADAAGVGLLNGGDLPGAIVKFGEALSLEPGFEPARLHLAAALAAKGHAELRAGAFDDAQADLERAVDLAPGDARLHLLLGALLFRRGDLTEARRRIDRAREIAPGLAEAREISGDIHYQEGSLELARSEWEAALASPGARESALRAKLDRAGREVDAGGAFSRDVSRHFTVQYDGPVPAWVARTVLRQLERAYDRLWRDFGRPPQHDVPVILYSRGLFAEITGSPGWVAGTYDGKIRVPVGGLETEQDAEQLEPILAHELTHAFIRSNVPGRLPLWFEEGLAMHFQGKSAESARIALNGVGFTSLAEVDVALRGSQRVSAGYGAAALAVAEMIRMDGFWLPRRILELVAAGRPFPDAFEYAAGIDLREFEERWVKAQH